MRRRLSTFLHSVRNCHQGRRGVVLIVVLVLVVMIALAGFGFLAAMSTEYEAVRLEGSRLQAEQTMASAEASVLWAASLTEQQRRLMGDITSNPGLFQGRVLEQLSAAAVDQTSGTVALQNLTTEPVTTGTQPDDRWRFSVVYLDNASLEGPQLRFGLRNESAKLHLASVLRWEQLQPGQGRASLMQLPGMTEAIADALLDWIDADDIPREFGAESDYYMTLSQPYRAGNSVPQNLEELLYVRGVTPRRLFGSNISAINSPSQSDSRFESDSLIQPNLLSPTSVSPQPQGFEAGALSAGGLSAGDDLISGEGSAEESVNTGLFGWSEYLTVISAERNRDPKGDLRTFVNGNSLPQLQSELSRVLPEQLVRFILLARQFGIQSGPNETTAGPSPAASNVMTVPFSAATPLQFPISNLADLIDGRVSVATSTGTTLVQSPLSTQSPDFPQQWTRITRQISASQDSVITGRINILQASEYVLRALPGMTAEAAAQIVSRRQELEPAPSSVGWILSENLMDRSGFRAMMPEVTTGGDVFEADIVVFRPIGGPVLRRKVRVDAASAPVRRLQWRDESSRALPYSLNQLLPSDTSSRDNSPAEASEG